MGKIHKKMEKIWEKWNLIDELLPLLYSEIPLIDGVLPGSRWRRIHL